MLGASAVSFGGLVYSLVHMAENSRIDDRSVIAVTFLKKIALSSLQVLHQGGGHCYMEGGSRLTFDASGVCNVYECLRCHKSMNDAMALAWGDMKEDNRLRTPFREASMMDVVSFLATVRRFRRHLKKKCWSVRMTQAWSQALWAVIKCLAAAVSLHCRHLQQSVDGIENCVIPSRRNKRLASRDPRFHFLVESLWFRQCFVVSLLECKHWAVSSCQLRTNNKMLIRSWIKKVMKMNKVPS